MDQDTIVTSHASPRFRALEPEKRSAVLSAAAEEFAAHGYEAASTNRIAANAGVSKGALFSYFPTKDLLFAGVIDTLLEQIQEEATPIRADADVDLFDALRAAAHAALSFHKRVPQLFALYGEVVYRGGCIPDRGRYMARYMAMSRDFFGALIDRARERGEIAPEISRNGALLVVDASINRLQDMLVIPALCPMVCPMENHPVDEATYHQLIDETLLVLRRALAR